MCFASLCQCKEYYSTYSLLLLNGVGALSAGLLLRLALLEKGLGDQDLVVGRNATKFD